MPIYNAPVKETRFILENVLDIGRYANLPGFANATPDLIEAILEEAGKFSAEAIQRPGLPDRDAASQLPETDYMAKDPVNAIYATVYRHFFDYRAQGFGKNARAQNDKLRVNNPGLTDVYFLGLGPHITDVPGSLLAALQNDPNLLRDKVTLRPLSKVLEVTDEAIRDRDTGAYGPAFRVDAV